MSVTRSRSRQLHANGRVAGVPLVLAESFAVFLFFQDSGMKTRTDKFAKKVKDITVRHAQQIELMPLGSRPTRPSR